MAAPLSKKDIFLIQKLRNEDVLQDVESHRLNQSDGVILISCADGDQFYDVFQNQVQTQVECRPVPRIHVLTCHGGALAYVPRSPVNKRRIAHDVYLDQIPDARKLKGINLLALYAHAPCGAAALANLDIDKVITLQMEAKLKIESLNAGLEVACFFHVEHPDERKRTYFICRTKWEAWAETNCVDTLTSA